MRPDAVRVYLLQQGHNELGLECHGASLAVAHFHIHSVDPIGTTHGIANDRAAQCFHQRAVLTLRVKDDNVIIGGQGDSNNQELGKEGLARAGNAQQHHGLVHQIVHVAEDQIVGNGILPEVNAPRLLNLLHLEGHEHRKALCSEGSKGIDFSCADG